MNEMDGMMDGMSPAAMTAVQRKQNEAMGINVTRQLMQWFQLDLNKTEDDALGT